MSSERAADPAPAAEGLGLNRRAIRAIYPQIDWDQYDREVVAEAAPPSAAREREALDRGALERACIASVGPWFDSGHESGRLAPMRLAQAILREYDRLAASEEPEK